MVASACFAVVTEVLSASTTMTIWPMWLASAGDFGRQEQGRRIEDDDPVRIPGRHLGDEATHPLACQQLRRALVPGTGRKQGELLDVRPQDDLGESQTRIGQHVEQPARLAEAAAFAISDGFATSASTSSTLLSSSIAMLMARFNAQKLFPSPARALVTISKLARFGADARLPLHVRDERPLDDSELLRDRGLRHVGGYEPLRRKRR